MKKINKNYINIQKIIKKSQKSQNPSFFTGLLLVLPGGDVLPPDRPVGILLWAALLPALPVRAGLADAPPGRRKGRPGPLAGGEGQNH